MMEATSAASAAKVMYLERTMAFEKNATNCKNYFKDGCSYPWCDMCGGYEPKKEHKKDAH